MHLIPNPRAYQALDGAFTLQDGEKVKSELRIPLVRTTTREARIIVTRNPALQKEAYTLNVTPEKVHITAATPIGAYYALQSLRILADYDIGGRTVPCCSIHDAPRWGWRGMSLDESRHFFGKEEVKRLLDMLFMMKLNVFHWHLTDDQGWRIEIKKYPRLTEIGSKRTCTQVDGWHTSHMVNEPHEGFYTQEDIREIVAYANARGIMVVPEIDMPAHFAAAQAAYPWLACRELEREVPGYFGGRVPTLHGVMVLL